MKHCPICNRAYADSLQFCLDDGTILTHGNDAVATLVMSHGETADKSATRQTALPSSQKLIYIVIAIGAVLLGGGAVALFKSITNDAPARNSTMSSTQQETEFDRPRGSTTPRTAFCFFMPNPPAGYRKLVKASNDVWLETQPDNFVFQHQVVGRVNYGPWRGLILRRLENRDGYPVELFVQDSGTDLESLLYRPPNGTWVAVSKIEDNISNCPLATDRPVNR